jgi:hypothetical protein
LLGLAAVAEDLVTSGRSIGPTAGDANEIDKHAAYTIYDFTFCNLF